MDFIDDCINRVLQLWCIMLSETERIGAFKIKKISFVAVYPYCCDIRPWSVGQFSFMIYFKKVEQSVCQRRRFTDCARGAQNLTLIPSIP